MTTVIFHDFPDLENSFRKFYDFPVCVGTPSLSDIYHFYLKYVTDMSFTGCTCCVRDGFCLKYIQQCCATLGFAFASVPFNLHTSMLVVLMFSIERVAVFVFMIPFSKLVMLNTFYIYKSC